MTRMPVALLGLLLLAGCIPAGHGPQSYDAPPRQERQDHRRDRPAREQDGGYRVPDRIDGDVSELPSPPPAWVARPARADARRVTGTSYTVQPGDTLRSISAKTGAGSEAIARANGIGAPFVIRPGQRLSIPGGSYHTVREGETGIAIARAYGTDWSRIVTANQLEEPYILRTGQRILIPDGGQVASAAPMPGGRPETIEERAARFHLDIDDIVTGGQPAVDETERPARPVATAKRVLPAVTPVAPPARLSSGFAWPVDGRVVRRFGPGASGDRSDGIQIAVPLGTPVLAAADGVVAYVGNDIPALGGLVILRHGDSWTTVYGHAERLLVRRGQSVKKGQRIALSGNTGFADRPELHFELRKGRTPVDPLPNLPSR